MSGNQDVTLGAVSELLRGVSYHPLDLLDHDEGGVPLLRATNIGNRMLELDDVLYVPPTLVRDYQFLRRYDVVIAMSSGSRQAIGRLAQLRRNWRGCVGAFCAVIRTDPSLIHPEFLGYILQSAQFRERIETFAEGTAIMNLSRERLSGFSFRLPQMHEQRAIARILGTLDDKIELNRRMNETLEAMARALFKSWFIDFDPVRAKADGRDPGLPTDIAALFPDSFQGSDLGEIPKGWALGVLDQFVDVVLGGDWGKDEETEETSESVRCIRGADIPDLQTGGTGKMPVRFLKRTSLQKRRLNDGDVVVEISGGSPTQSTGRPVLVSGALLGRLDMPLVCSNFCRLVKLKSPALSKFVYLWLRSLYANDKFLQFENGTTGIKNLAFTRFSSNYRLCIPPLQVLEAFDKQVSPLFKKQQAAAGETDTLSALWDALLPKLLSGELRVSLVDDPSMEFS